GLTAEQQDGRSANAEVLDVAQLLLESVRPGPGTERGRPGQGRADPRTGARPGPGTERGEAADPLGDTRG
ncbi:hypothetical protein CGZ96_10620, partial [Enemella evansiae]